MDPPVSKASRLSRLADEMTGSEILRVAADVRTRVAEGHQILNLTVGDFDPAEFPIPQALEEAVVAALKSRQTNYPTPTGMDALRTAIVGMYARRLGLHYSPAQTVVGCGARPLIYALFRAVVDPGDRVVFSVPSWNNNYYCQLVGATPVPVGCTAQSNFQPTVTALRPALRGARLLSLNSPLNPTGTLFDAETLGGVCDLVLEENARRGPGERPLYLMYDQVYWMLTFGGAAHVTPLGLRPAIAPYTILVDAISKSFAATGLRVGWAVGAPDVIGRMSDISNHVGSWAPRPEQVGAARLLEDDATMEVYHARMRDEVQRRLRALANGLAAMRADGLPVDSTIPQGAIYLSARFDLYGRRAPAGDGRPLATHDDIRRYLLLEAGLAVVPFQAFAAMEETGWFRLSVGTVSVEAIERMMPRLREAIERLQ